MLVVDRRNMALEVVVKVCLRCACVLYVCMCCVLCMCIVCMCHMLHIHTIITTVDREKFIVKKILYQPFLTKLKCTKIF